MDKSSWISLRPSSDSAQVFQWGDRAVEVLQAFGRLRQLGRFCDVVLVAGERRLPAHRALLASSCPYFDAMFTSGMKEKQQQEVELCGLSSEGLQAVLDFLYSGELQLDAENIISVLEAAHLLQVLHVVDFCCQYLEQQVNEDTYLYLQELARFYSLERLDGFIDCFILQRFAKLSLTAQFLQQTSLSKITRYLCSSQVQQDGEQALLHAALQWLTQSPERTDHAHQLLSHIRFPLIPMAELVGRALPALRALLPDDAGYKQLVEEALDYHSRISAQPVLQSRRTQLRGGVERLLLTGGEEYKRGQHLSTCVIRLDGPPGFWQAETELPVQRSHHCLAVLGGFVFVAGGSTSRYGDPDTACDLLHRYDPRERQWTRCAPMNQARADFFLGAMGECLIAVGGRNDTGAQFSVEVYKPTEDRWSFVSRLPRDSYGHSGTILDGVVYISGGQSGVEGPYYSDLLSYDPKRDVVGWVELEPMIVARSWHCMASLPHLVFAIGGSTLSVQLAEQMDTQQVECYDVRHRQWTQVAPLLHPSSEAAAAVWAGRVYVLGGYSWDTMEFFSSVQVYDPEQRQWTRGPDVPTTVAGTAACVCMLRPDRTQAEPSGRP